MSTSKKLLSFIALTMLAMATTGINAANISVDDAQAAAKGFIRQHTAAGTFRAAATTDLKLAHIERSSAVTGANAYYAFNVKGGGFVIIAGEDRATRVLGYSDQGQLDFDNLPDPLNDLLASYKAEIEFLQTYQGNDLVPAPASFTASGTVGPLIQSTWGQEMPYYLQCPMYQGEYSAVGCIATAMAQVMYYWQYPTTMQSQNRYYCSELGAYVPALPATTIDYSLMLDSYCHWDWNTSQLIQDTYTDAQAQEVAKLGRYCGQSVQMAYSPEGSGAYTNSQLSAMKRFGFSNSSLYTRSSGWSWGGNSYSNAQWENMIKNEIDAGRPILYSANDPDNGGHAFICDGYNAEGLFHFNLGWYGTCDGWYASTALNMTHREGDYLKFNSGHEMITGIEPPAYCVLQAEQLNAASGLIVLGESLTTEAQNVTLRTSYSNLNLLFGLADENGNSVCTSAPVSISKNTFEQGSTITGAITLPATLAGGNYQLKLYYYTTSANNATAVDAASAQLTVVGHVAKYNEPFSISDVTKTVNLLLSDTNSTLTIKDVTTLIDYLLTTEQ